MNSGRYPWQESYVFSQPQLCSSGGTILTDSPWGFCACASELFQCLYYEHDPWGARGNDLSHGHCVGVWINQVEHDTCLWAVMKGLEAAVVTLNSDKCEFGSSQRTTISMKWLCVGGSSQEQGFAQIKAELSQPTVLALVLYSPKPPTKLSAVALS